MEITHLSSHKPEIHAPLRWVAKLALGVGAIATAGLVITLSVLTDSSGISYGDLIQSHSIAQSYLGPVLLISGCLLIAVTAICTWLITLYSSFRIAGPLFRFSRNLETAITAGPRKPIPIREGDSLQQDAALLASSLAALEVHYANLHEEVAAAITQIKDRELDQTQLQMINVKLKQLIEHVNV